MAGARSKLTPEVETAICEALRNGGTWATAAAAAGVHIATLNRWRVKGEEAKSGRYRALCDAATRASQEGGAVAAAQVFASFTQTTTETREEVLPDGALKRITITRPPDAGMALRFLERRFPSEWSPKRVLEHVGEGGGPMKVETSTTSDEALLEMRDGIAVLTAAEREALEAILLAMGRGHRPDEDHSVARITGHAFAQPE